MAMTSEEAIEVLRAIRIRLAELYNQLPERYQAQRRFLGRFDRTVLIIIGQLNGNILDKNAYDSIASEFDNATGRLKKLKDNLAQITSTINEANNIIDNVMNVFKQIPRP